MPSSVMNRWPTSCADVEAAVRPRLRQIRPEIGVGDERQRDDRHDPAGGAPRRFEQQHDEDDAEHDVELGRRGGAVGEILAAVDGVDQDRRAGEASDHVPPADAVAKPRRHRKQQEAQHQHEGDVGVAQRLRGDDRESRERPGAGDGGVEMKQRHRHGDGGDQRAGQADEPVDAPSSASIKSSALRKRLVGNGRVGSRSPGHFLGHVVPCRCAYDALYAVHQARSRREKPALFAGRCARGRVN